MSEDIKCLIKILKRAQEVADNEDLPSSAPKDPTDLIYFKFGYLTEAVNSAVRTLERIP